jgi:hypothetical protein
MTFWGETKSTGDGSDQLFDQGGLAQRATNPKMIKAALRKGAGKGKKDQPRVDLGIPNGMRHGVRLEDFEYKNPYRTTSAKITKSIVRLGLSKDARAEVKKLKDTHKDTTVWRITTANKGNKVTYEKMNGFDALKLRAHRAVGRRALALGLLVGVPALAFNTSATPGQFIDDQIAAFTGGDSGSQIGTANGVSVNGKKAKPIVLKEVDTTCVGGVDTVVISKKDTRAEYPALEAMQRSFGDTALDGFAYNDPELADQFLTAMGKHKSLGGGEALPDNQGAEVRVPLECGPTAQ